MTTLRQPEHTFQEQHISETSEIKIKPIIQHDQNAEHDVSNVEISLPLIDTDSLRLGNIDKNRFFEQFLATIFNNKKAEVDNDQMQVKIYEKSTEETKQSKFEKDSEPNSKIESKTKSKSKSKTKAKLKRKSKSKLKRKLKRKVKTKSKRKRKRKTKINRKLKTKTKGKTEADTGRVGGQKLLPQNNVNFGKLIPVHKLPITTEEDNSVKSVPKLHNKNEVVKEKLSSYENKKMELVLKNIFDSLEIPDFLGSHSSYDEGKKLRKGEEKKKPIDLLQNKEPIDPESNEPLTKSVTEGTDHSIPTFLHTDANNKEEESTENDAGVNNNNQNLEINKSNLNEKNEGGNINDSENNYESESNEKYEVIDGNKNDEENKIVIVNSDNYETGVSNDIENNYESDSNESDDYEALSIETNSGQDFTPRSNDTQKVLDMLTDVDDIHELVNQAFQLRRNNKDIK